MSWHVIIKRANLRSTLANDLVNHYQWNRNLKPIQIIEWARQNDANWEIHLKRGKRKRNAPEQPLLHKSFLFLLLLWCFRFYFRYLKIDYVISQTHKTLRPLLQLLWNSKYSSSGKTNSRKSSLNLNYYII